MNILRTQWWGLFVNKWHPLKPSVAFLRHWNKSLQIMCIILFSLIIKVFLSLNIFRIRGKNATVQILTWKNVEIESLGGQWETTMLFELGMLTVLIFSCLLLWYSSESGLLEYVLFVYNQSIIGTLQTDVAISQLWLNFSTWVLFMDESVQ